MSGTFPRARRRAFLAAALAILPIQAGTTVTLCNRSGRDLLVSREPGPDGAPIPITARSDEDPWVLRRLQPPPRRAEPQSWRTAPPFWEKAKSETGPETGPGLPLPKPAEPGQARLARPGETVGPRSQPSSHYLLEAGGVAMFCFEGRDLDTELVIYRLDEKDGMTIGGLILTPASPAL